MTPPYFCICNVVLRFDTLTLPVFETNNYLSGLEIQIFVSNTGRGLAIENRKHFSCNHSYIKYSGMIHYPHHTNGLIPAEKTVNSSGTSKVTNSW